MFMQEGGDCMATCIKCQEKELNTPKAHMPICNECKEEVNMLPRVEFMEESARLWKIFVERGR